MEETILEYKPLWPFFFGTCNFHGEKWHSGSHVLVLSILYTKDLSLFFGRHIRELYFSLVCPYKSIEIEKELTFVALDCSVGANEWFRTLLLLQSWKKQNTDRDESSEWLWDQRNLYKWGLRKNYLRIVYWVENRPTLYLNYRHSSRGWAEPDPIFSVLLVLLGSREFKENFSI